MMIHRPLTAFILTLAGLAGGCATAQPAVPAASLPPCTLGPGLAGWHQVSTDQVSFCVPGDWISAGARGWRGAGGTITWDAGEPRRREIATSVVTVPADQLPASAGAPVTPTRTVHRSTETIDGDRVELWISEREGSYITGADWESGRAVYMTGEAVSRSAAEVQLDIYRTARW